jgi:predicted nucleic acid-binding protein
VILLDTNVISEVLRPAPEPAVLAWLRLSRRRELWTCSIVLAELFSGVDMMPAGKRQQILREKMDDLVSTLFAGQISNFDVAAARAYGSILARRQAMGHRISELDAQIAAIAVVCGATLATRNIQDFEHCGIQLIDPWEAP